MSTFSSLMWEAQADFKTMLLFNFVQKKGFNLTLGECTFLGGSPPAAIIYNYKNKIKYKI
jgi:hypothetical protein